MTPADPRPGLREVAPYVSPQLDVAARLNTNECPLPLPAGFADDLAARVRGLARGLNRYPDGQMRELRDAIAAAITATPRRASGPRAARTRSSPSCSPPTAGPAGGP